MAQYIRQDPDTTRARIRVINSGGGALRTSGELENADLEQENRTIIQFNIIVGMNTISNQSSTTIYSFICS